MDIIKELEQEEIQRLGKNIPILPRATPSSST